MGAAKKGKSKKKIEKHLEKNSQEYGIKIIYEVLDKHDAYRSNKVEDIVEDEVCNLGI